MKLTGKTQAALDAEQAVGGAKTSAADAKRRLNVLMRRVVNRLVNGQAIPQNLVDNWNAAWQDLANADAVAPGIEGEP